MAFVDNLKNIARKKAEKKFKDEEYEVDSDLADEIRRDPQYSKVIAKLQELTIEKEQLINRLRKIELDIDTCLVLISINKEKEQIENEK